MKKLVSIITVAVMTFTIFPAMVFANEPVQLAAPTELNWGRYYNDDGTYKNYSGMISWKANDPDQQKAYVKVYKKGEINPVYEADWSFSHNDCFHSIGGFVFHSDEIETGDYYFTVQSLGDGNNYMDSEIAVSETWTYVKPSINLPELTGIKWNWPYASADSLAGNYVGGYQVRWFYAENESEHPYSIGISWKLLDDGNTSFPEDGIKPKDSWLQRFGEGLYYFKVRALSSDITQIQNGIWSQMSPAYNFTETVNEIEESLTNILESQLTPQQIRSQVQALDFEDLEDAMFGDNNGTGVVSLIEQLEDKTGSNLEISVNDGLSSRIPEAEIDVVGALLNNVNSNTVTLNIGKPENADDVIPAIYSNVAAVKFSMDLDGVENASDLTVPVKITFPVPAGINPDYLVILHYSITETAPELINPYVFNKGTQWYASFTLDHFSDFVMTHEIHDFKFGDINNDGNVTQTDKLILSRYLAKWDGYAGKILNWDAADINGDKDVTQTDKLILARYLAKWDGYDRYFKTN